MGNKLFDLNSIAARLGFSQKKRNRRGRRNTYSRPLRIESLEDRRMLTTITVDSFLDNFDPNNPTTDGVITLREAIVAANTDSAVGDAPAGSGADTIVFQGTSSDNKTILLDRAFLGEITINDTENLTIDASALGSLTIDADDPTPGRTGTGIRIFNITDPSSGVSPPLVELVGLTLTGADADGNRDGGAIRSEGRLIVRDSIIVENEANRGGGIYVNVAGGASSREVLRIENTLIDSNDAATGGGVAVVSGSSGTATTDTIVITDNTTFFDNTTNFGNGAGLYTQLFGADMTIDGNTSFSLNEAGNGGGLYADLNSNASLTMNGVVLEENDATSRGAGLFADINTQSTVQLNQTTFDGNEATSQGGGLYADASGQSTINVINSLFFQNDATNNGGGAYVQARSDSTVSVNQVTFDDNRSINSDGGGLYADLAGASALRSTLRIENNSTFVNNVASDSGGGLYTVLGNESNVEIVDSSFSFNASTGVGSSSGGGAIFSDFNSNADALLAITDSKITGNIATEGGGVRVDMPSVGHTQANGSVFTMQRTVVDFNRATNRGGGIFTGVGSGGEVTIEDSTITGNDAGLTLLGSSGELRNSGGGMYAYLFSYQTAATLTITGTTIDNNTAGEHGGGLAVCTKRQNSSSAISSLDVTNTTISGNQAGYTTASNTPGTGGGVHLAVYPFENEEALDAYFQNSTITGNTADTGGGIYSFIPTANYPNARNNVVLTNTIVSGNARQDGNANNFWGSINAAESRYNLISDVNPTVPYDPMNPDPNADNRFVDHITHLDIAFSSLGLGAGNLDNGGTNDPSLGPLQFNGGLTRTHRPLTGSPAIDAGDDSLAVIPFTSTPLTTDQRGIGFSRIFDVPGVGTGGSFVDIGAYEINPPKIIDVAIRGPNTLDGVDGLYSIPTGSGQQIRTVPIGGADIIEITFSEEIDSATLGNALMLDGAYTLNSYTTDMVYQLDYDPLTNIATWGYTPLVVNDFLPTDQMVLTLKDTLTSTSGVQLDGEWVNPTSVNQSTVGLTNLSVTGSGDGAEAGDFVFYFTIMPADFNLDNLVNVAGDGVIFIGNLGVGTNFAQGDANGDGSVTINPDGLVLVGLLGFDFSNWP